jgi:hypothetical protein
MNAPQMHKQRIVLFTGLTALARALLRCGRGASVPRR